MSTPSTSASEWRRRARRAAAKINAAWWLDKLTVPLVVVALIGACLILVARRELEVIPWLRTILTGAGLLLAMGLVAWWAARPHFETEEEALVRIEASMKLRNSLSAARSGVAPWPSLPATIDDGTRWYWPRLVVPLVVAALFVASSVLLPVTAKTDPDAPPVEEPQAWKDLEASLKTLDEEDTVQEQYLREMEKRLEEMRRQNPEEWFSHSSLEATDALQKMHRSEVENLEKNLKQAERALGGLRKHGDHLGEASRQRLLNDFDKALEQLGNGAMKPDADLLKQLENLDPKQLGQLDPQQLEQLRQNMRQRARQLQQARGQGQNQPGQEWLDDLMEEDDPG